MVSQPVRYLSMLISRMTRADAATVALDIVPPPGVTATRTPGVRIGGNRLIAVRPPLPPIGSRNTIDPAIDANRRRGQGPRGAGHRRRHPAALRVGHRRRALRRADDREEQPAGRARLGYMAVKRTTRCRCRLTPGAATRRRSATLPEFFLAHEVAHQWFGQAIGWKNYHEQWLSEGFAQYMAALFARERRGESTFRDILKQFRRWSLNESSEGPIYLGYRLGHIKGEGRVFRALVYNKGAAVLHMLRLFVGDEAFFRGVRRFYRENRFAKAGTEDLQKAMEAESGLALGRFFERWIYDSGIPRVRYATSVEGGEVIVRVEQAAPVYDMPITVTIQYADGSAEERVMRVTEPAAELRIPVQKAVRNVDLNDDNATVAQLDKMR
ncbi:MAG: M1 family aminopeptidase [Vicinamibacterales bacterium]